MSRPDPTWYGTILRPYAAWIVAVALAVAAWPMWRWVILEGSGDPFDRLGSVIIAFVTVMAGGGLVLTRLVGLPWLSGLVTLGCLALSYPAAAIHPALPVILLAFAPGAGAAVAGTPEGEDTDR
ncbi:hypothetical protein ACWZJV_09520 [Nocardioides sp. WG-D5]